MLDVSSNASWSWWLWLAVGNRCHAINDGVQSVHIVMDSLDIIVRSIRRGTPGTTTLGVVQSHNKAGCRVDPWIPISAQESGGTLGAAALPSVRATISMASARVSMMPSAQRSSRGAAVQPAEEPSLHRQEPPFSPDWGDADSEPVPQDVGDAACEGQCRARNNGKILQLSLIHI